MNIKYQEKYEQLGTNIMLLRREAKMTQEELSVAVNVTRNHISKVELGKGSPSLDCIFALAEFFKLPAKQFFEFRE